MPAVPLFPPSKYRSAFADNSPSPPNPLPELLQTPSGLAILELQGTIVLPTQQSSSADAKGDADADVETSENNLATTRQYQVQTPIGRLVIPDYDSSNWQKRIYLFVGRHQRLTGEVKKLPKPLAVIRRRTTPREGSISADGDHDELEIVQIISHKIIFSSRPEPFTETMTV